MRATWSIRGGGIGCRRIGNEEAFRRTRRGQTVPRAPGTARQVIVAACIKNHNVEPVVGLFHPTKNIAHTDCRIHEATDTLKVGIIDRNQVILAISLDTMASKIEQTNTPLFESLDKKINSIPHGLQLGIQ